MMIMIIIAIDLCYVFFFSTSIRGNLHIAAASATGFATEIMIKARQLVSKLGVIIDIIRFLKAFIES